jgi:hypothetical protein
MLLSTYYFCAETYILLLISTLHNISAINMLTLFKANGYFLLKEIGKMKMSECL